MLPAVGKRGRCRAETLIQLLATQFRSIANSMRGMLLPIQRLRLRRRTEVYIGYAAIARSMKLFPLIIAGLLLFCGIVSAQPVMFEKYEFQLLQSRVEFSQNRRYVFVRVPTMPIDQYEREVVRELLAAGRTKKEIANFQHSKRYSDALRAERESRIAYPETGLYDAVSGSLLKRFPDFPIECERIFVSDSG